MPILHVQSAANVADASGNVVPLLPDAALSLHGPRIQVTVGVAQSIAQQLLQRGIQPPVPVSGDALIDTGAAATCIDQADAQQLGLPLIEVVHIASASHSSTQQPVYPARIEIPGLTTIDVPQAIGAPLKSLGLVALIGRDVLAHVALFYNGPAGQFTLAR